MSNARNIAGVERLCLLKDKSLKNLGLICIVEKIYIKYREMKVEFFTRGDAIWIGYQKLLWLDGPRQIRPQLGRIQLILLQQCNKIVI